MINTTSKHSRRKVRHERIRSVIITHDKPRLVVFRSLKHIYGQILDDTAHKTLASASDLQLKGKMTKKEKAKAVGKLLAEKAKVKQISSCVFDRAGFQYHGRVKELADGAREGGLQF